ncbi:sigma 54-interacting transcriptional regulator [Sorangium cellulosum]|uniref:sigma 54-interacting transcriptional regulator n=1 Tax=Sorangium cellulosum TaxID=56 RepID=UPI001F5CF3F1|nr:sigma 54-interacting transcriptional regulator [Sorangium cellulosum]
MSRGSVTPQPLFPPRYAPIGTLGKGGGGEVWAVRDRITGKTVALKTLGEDADEPEVLALVREAAALSGVEGLGVPRVLRFGRLPGSGRPFLVRELVEGTSLADRLAQKGDLERNLAAIADTADQLTRLHRALVLHGDVKPANIIVGEGGRATLVDLGLSAPFRDNGSRPVGLTPRYAAPELFQGDPLTVRAEVFALGATLAEALRESGGERDPEVVEALRAVVERATERDPIARYPSADELANALRRAARLPRAPDEEAAASCEARERPEADAVVWPIVGLDAPSARLHAQITALGAGGELAIVGPPGSGRSALLRRVAWSLEVGGDAVAWIEAGSVADPREALAIELSGHDLGRVTALVDDADRLGPAALERLDEVREAGGKLVLVVRAQAAGAGAAGAGAADVLAGRAPEIFAMEPLEEQAARELVQRTIPSLSDAVAAHVVARAGRWPGRIREIVRRIARAPVASTDDVDALLDAPPSSGGAAASPGGAEGASMPPAEIHRLLDRGHFGAAAEALERCQGDGAPAVVIARARLAMNRGDPARALAELHRVKDEVEASGDRAQAAFWSLQMARALVRAGDYGEAERRAGEAAERVGPIRIEAELAAEPAARPAPAGAFGASPEAILAEAVAMRGLAQSFASRHEEAKRTLEQAVRLARLTGEPRILSVALVSLAFALQRDDRLSEAKAAYEEALSAAEQAGDAGTLTTTRLNLAGIAKLQGDLAAAIRHLEAAVDLGQRSGRVATLRQALLNLSNLDLYLGRLARARVSIDALAAQRADLAPQQHAQLLALEAEHAARSGDLERAERLCLECAEAYEAMGRRVDAVEARLERVLFAVARPGADTRALGEEIDAAAARLGSTGAHRALLALARGRVAALARDEQRARAAYDEALEAARAAGQRDWIWRALEARAQLEAERGHLVRARHDREEALITLEEIASKLPRDLREVFWNDARRKEIRAAAMLDLMSGRTVPFTQSAGPPGEDRLARVLEINRAIAGEHDLGRLLAKVTDHAIALLSAERGFIILQRPPRDEQRPPRDEPPPPRDEPQPAAGEGEGAVDLSIHASRDQAGDDPHARFSSSIAERVISTGEPVVTASARDDARMSDYVSVHQLMLQSVACVPIRVRSGQVIGALYLETRLRPAAKFEAELPTLTALSDQIAIAIETARLVSENERRARELERANEELRAARAKLEELLGHRTAQLAATRRDLRSARAVLRGHFGYEGLVGTSEAMRRVYALIDRVKDTDIPILITGESGTGKEVVARTIHNASPRAKKPFVGVNCGAIPEHLLESELFGHVRGAFTGADRDRKGLFREVTGGTILLDEIGEMPQKMQAGLLRVLQEKVVRPVGGAREEPVDARVIAATHRDLGDMVSRGAFREDLFYRLLVVEVRIPPLRERIEDIPLLIDHFLGIFAARYGRDRRSVSRAALKRLSAYGWPGNVRQLENVLLNAWVLSDRPELESDDFELPDAAPRSLRGGEAAPRHDRGAAGGGAPAASAGRSAPPSSEPRRVETSLDAHKASERERILLALSSCNWNRVKAAQIVGLPRRTFYRRLKEYGIQ